MRFTVVTTAKNEGPYFLEWVAYHRTIGVTDILVYQNDSEDFTDPILKLLRDIGAIQYFANRADPGTHQLRAYKRAMRQEAVKSADWVMAIDMDEFVYIKPGGGTLTDLLATVPKADAILLNWRRFGNAGERLIQDALVTERFCHAESARRVATHLTPYKALFRPDAYGQFGIHQPRDPLRPEDDIRWVNGSGLTPKTFARQGFRATDPGRWRFAQINHYITRDAASFLVKSDRGSAHQSQRGIDSGYWRKRNFNDEADFGLARRAPAIRDEMNRLDAACDGKLSVLRRQALAWHRERFAALLEQAAFRELYDFCVGCETADRTAEENRWIA